MLGATNISHAIAAPAADQGQATRPGRRPEIGRAEGCEADQDQGDHQYVARDVMGDHGGRDGHHCHGHPTDALLPGPAGAKLPGGQQGEGEERQGERLVDEHRVERVKV